jgi:hypothetical protein
MRRLSPPRGAGWEPRDVRTYPQSQEESPGQRRGTLLPWICYYLPHKSHGTPSTRENRIERELTSPYK